MGWKILLSCLFALLAIGMLFFYWFIPSGEIKFTGGPVNPNFSISGSDSMQFYENMRFANPNLSYRINACSMQKQSDMKQAFDFLSSKTILKFYETSSNEDIIIECEDKQRFESGMFIAGEGGPTNISQTNKFNIISHGKILLLRDSTCSFPNIALHELLHVLGFSHSLNKNNLMYNITDCSQTLGEDIPSLINSLYSAQDLPDISFKNVNATMHGKYLDASIALINNGLKDSGSFKVNIYADDELVKEVPIEEIKIGYGRLITLTSIWVGQINIEKISYVIETGFPEMDKKNNKIELKVS